MELLTPLTLFTENTFKRGYALLLHGGRIERVASAEELRFFEEIAKVHAFEKERLVLPAFVDAHAHVISHGLSMLRPNLEGAKSLEEALQQVEAEARAREGEDLLIFESFDQSVWPEARFPTREELDRVAPDRPVILRRICGHLGVANSKGLTLLPKDSEEIDSETGLLLEGIPLNLARLFPSSLEEVKLGFLKAQERLHQLGIAAIHEFGRPQTFRALTELETAGVLKLRVYFHFYEDYLPKVHELGLTTGMGSEFLRFGGIKVFLDGSVGARTAAFYEPYKDEPEKTGLLLKTREEMEDLIRQGEEYALQFLFHAIGDRAIGGILEAFGKTLPGGNPLRHRIEHFEFPKEEQIQKVAELGILTSMQPNFALRWGEEGALYDKHLGWDRAGRNNPLRDLVASGTQMAFGSDGMPYSPLYGIRGAIDHPVEKQRLTLEEALQAYTTAGAYFSFEEEERGVIREGQGADFVILDGDVKALERGEAQISELYVKGEKVYDVASQRV